MHCTIRPKQESNCKPALLAALVAVALFAVTLRGTYIYDDLFITRDDPRLHDPERWGQYWTQGYAPQGVDNLYRPLVSMSYALEVWLHGDRPWIFHLVNVLLYGACAGMVAELARRLAGTRAAYVAGLLFAVHPLHVEAVAGIVGRAEVMGALAFAGGLALFVDRPLTMGRVWGIVGCCAAAILSKEQGLLLPLILLAWAGVRRWRSEGRGSAPAQERQAGLWLVLLLSWMLAGYIAFREWLLPMEWERGFLDWSVNPLIRSTGLDRWLMPFALLGRYAVLLVFPLHLSIDYGGAVFGRTVRWHEPDIYLGFAAAGLWLVLTGLAWSRRWAVALFCLVGMALTYGMVSNFGITIGTIFGERLMFLPSVFFVILVGLALCRLPRRWLIGVMAVLVTLGALRSFTYARQWNDRLGLYRYTVAHQPLSVRAHILEAEELMRQGRLDEAAEVAAAGRKVLPDYYDIWRLSAEIALKRGRLDEAERDITVAIRTAPNPLYLGALREQIEQRRERRRAENVPEQGGG